MKKSLGFIKKIVAYIQSHWVLALIAALVIAVAAWWFLSRPQSTTELKFEQPKRAPIAKVLDVSGTINAKQKARLRFLSGGKVVYLGAQQGDKVKKWQSIATIDRAALQKQQDQLLNKYMQERWDWEQVIDTTKDKSITTTEQRTKDKDQWDLTNKVIDVEIQNIAIRNTVLTAPFDGILTVSPTAVSGVQLTASDYFEVVNPDSIYFSAVVDEADIGKVSVGQTAELILDAFADETYTTQVKDISFTSIVGDNGTAFAVEFPLAVQSFKQQVRLGMNGDVKIILDKRDEALTIPLSATKNRDDKVYVDIKKADGTTEEREITVGIESDEAIEVLSGLTEQDFVLIP